jgi:hypothetical protein
MAKVWYDALHSMRGPSEALALLVELFGEKLSREDRDAIHAEFGDGGKDVPEGDNICPDCLAVVPVIPGPCLSCGYEMIAVGAGASKMKDED